MKKFTCLIMLLLFFVVTSCASLTDKGMISLEILKDNVAVNELDVRVGDIFQLEAETTQEVTPTPQDEQYNSQEDPFNDFNSIWDLFR